MVLLVSVNYANMTCVFSPLNCASFIHVQKKRNALQELNEEMPPSDGTLRLMYNRMMATDATFLIVQPDTFSLPMANVYDVLRYILLDKRKVYVIKSVMKSTNRVFCEWLREPKAFILNQAQGYIRQIKINNVL